MAGQVDYLAGDPGIDKYRENPQEGDQDIVICFDGTLRTEVHAMHTTLTCELPEGSLILEDDGLSWARFQAKMAIIALIGGEKTLGDDIPANQFVTNGYWKEQDINRQGDQRCPIAAFSLEQIPGKFINFTFPPNYHRLHYLLFKARME